MEERELVKRHCSGCEIFTGQNEDHYYQCGMNGKGYSTISELTSNCPLKDYLDYIRSVLFPNDDNDNGDDDNTKNPDKTDKSRNSMSDKVCLKQVEE